MEGIDKHDAKCRGSTRGFFLDRLRQRPVGKVYAVKWNDVLDSVWHLVDKEENYHNVVYNKDLDQPAIVAGRTTLQDFYQLTEDYPVSLTHYECRLVFNHWRKTLKIGAGWKHFCEILLLTADMEIVFEFIDPNVNRVLYWQCL
ncbi:hypothetical protein GmHk_03G007238 [Glycine max]|nr:hypothetical protein GmHk_03G007238 [Glycine max]